MSYISVTEEVYTAFHVNVTLRTSNGQPYVCLNAVILISIVTLEVVLEVFYIDCQKLYVVTSSMGISNANSPSPKCFVAHNKSIIQDLMFTYISDESFLVAIHPALYYGSISQQKQS